MDSLELERFLSESLDDERLSRGEKQVLSQLMHDMHPDLHQQGLILHKAFELARKKLTDPRDGAILGWLQDVVKVLRPAAQSTPVDTPVSRTVEAWFTPGLRAVGRLRGLMGNCRKSLDVCMFTITHDDLAEGLLRACQRKVQVRIITDDEKVNDLGSDIRRLRKAGIEIRTDSSPAHMHHKFALFDGSLMVTGSFNWTRSAVESNQDSFIVTDEPALVKSYLDEFEHLWAAFAENRRTLK